MVIPTRRRPNLLPQSVAAVLAQVTDAPFEVLVVNDDAEPLRCRLPDDPRLRVLTGSARGVSSARNIGIRAARSPILAFTDDDTVASPGWLAAALDAFAANPDALGVEGPFDYERDPDILYEHVPGTVLPGTYCSANIAYRTAAVVAAGMFDERFRRAACEDIDLGLRIAALGEVVWAPAMTMGHPPRAVSYREWVGRGRLVENDYLLHRKHPDLSPHRLPLRWGPVVFRARIGARMLRDPAVTQGSPARMLRAAALSTGLVTVAFVTACTRRYPDVRVGVS